MRNEGNRVPCRPWLSIGFAVIVLAVPTRAQATGSLAFTWLAPAGCPAESEVATEIARLLGTNSPAPAHGDLRVRASVEHGSPWSISIESSSGASQGYRTLSATSCQELANATALIVALMIDPSAAAARAERPKPPAPPLPATAPPTPPPPAPRKRTTATLAGLGAAGNLGVVPEADLGIGAALGAAGRSWRIELRVAYHPRWVNSSNISDPPNAHARFRFLAGTLAGCWTLTYPLLSLGPCGDFEFGTLRGEGSGVTRPASQTRPWLGLGLGGFLALRASGWLYFPVHIDAIVPILQHEFVFQNVDGPIFRVSPVGGRLTAGVEMHF
jgi:hypothetical protein